MRAFTRSIVLAGVSLAGVTGLMAETKLSHVDQWFRGKFGQASPPEEARLRAERESAAYRAQPATPTKPDLPYMDQYFRGKHGQFTPVEEAKLRVERESAAFRSDGQPSNYKPEPYVNQYLRMKQGISR